MRTEIFDPYDLRKKLHATGFINPKATTLFFDRVWLPCDITEYDSNDFNSISKLIEKDSVGFFENFYLSYDYGALAYMGAAELNCGRKILRTENLSEIEYYGSHYRNMAINEYAQSIKRRYKIDVVPVYLDSTEFEEELDNHFENVQSKVISVCIDNFPKIAEENLRWEQVLDFKHDFDAVKALHRFHRWVRLELNEMNKSEIEDTLIKDLEDYKFALKKHGVLTTTGAISTIIAAVPSIFEVFSGTANYLPVSISLAAGISIYTIDKTIEFYEKKREPIAFIYDMVK